MTSPGLPSPGPAVATTPAPDPGSSAAPRGLPSGAAVICCYTPLRLTATVAAVGSVLAQDVPLKTVVVVDHHDGLLALLRAELTGRPQVRVLPSTGVPGLSGARNTGVAATEADVVLFLDDDAVAEPGWAAALLACFTDPAVMAAGGTVEPAWEGGSAPAWFPAEFGWVVGCSYTGQYTGPPGGRARVRNPIGASMAVRRSAVDLVGGFSSALGRVGTLPVGCEETELCLRIDRELPGSTVLLEPASRVRHLVPVQRQRVGYAVRRCFHEGRSKAAVARIARSASGLRTEADYTRTVLPRAVARHLRRAAGGSAADARAAFTLIAGLSAAVAGFGLETVRGRLRR